MEALALKYRPKNFNALIGQEAVSKSLSHALSEGRISHAYLFSGLRGSGKTSSARIFSKALVCENGPTASPCEVCAGCRMANEGRHMDIIEMDAASHRKIDDIRELIEQTRYSPSTARFKIFIIDEVHMLTTEAFNALLKTLEEPPSYVKFILATTDPLKLPVTVLSRTQHFRFKQIPRYAILKHLEYILAKEGVEYELGALEILARSGGGSLRDTLTLLDQAIIYSTGKVTQNSVADMLGLLDPAKIEEILSIVAAQDKERARELLAELEGVDAEMLLGELSANIKAKFLENDGRFSLLVYERFMRILAQARATLASSPDSGFVFGIMLFMMIEAMNIKSIDEAIDEASATLNALPKQSQANKHMLGQTPASPSPQPPAAPTQVAPAPAPAAAPKAPSPAQPSYASFLEKIYDRDYDLGLCFDKNISFIGFENDTLKLVSKASGEAQSRLRASSRAIMQILKQVYSQSTKIEILPARDTSASAPDTHSLPSSEIDDIDAEFSRLVASPATAQSSEAKPRLDEKEISLADMVLGINNSEQKEQNQRQRLLDDFSRYFGTPISESEYLQKMQSGFGQDKPSQPEVLSQPAVASAEFDDAPFDAD